MRISDWSSDVCSSDLLKLAGRLPKPTLLSSTWMNPPPSSPCLRLPPLSATLSSSPTTSAGFRLSRRSCREASSPSVTMNPILPISASAPEMENEIYVEGLPEIGRANVCTPVTNANLVCRSQLEKKQDKE